VVFIFLGIFLELFFLGGGGGGGGGGGWGGGGGGLGGVSVRFILSSNITAHCILSGEYPRICTEHPSSCNLANLSVLLQACIQTLNCSVAPCDSEILC